MKRGSLAGRPVKPERFLALGFLALIAVGGLLLALPASAVGGRSIGLRGGLFTATSAVCVTGLSIIDVGGQLSSFGQAVLLVLIQVGGMGFMVFATLIMMALGKRITLKERVLLRDSMNQTTLAGMVRLTRAFSLMALAIEGVGALLLMPRLIPRYGLGQGVWRSVFTAVSAFCNAGFDLFGGYRSLLDFQGDAVVLLTLSLLIILGGLGFPVILECLHLRFKLRKASLHVKLVLCVTAALLLSGMAAIALLEWRNPQTLDNGLGAWQKVLNSFFQSVTFRTAGFASLDQASLSDSSKLVGSLLMFVGASPASTGGGVKTTTVATLFLVVGSVVRGRERICAFGRELSADTARRAMTIVIIGLLFVLGMTCALSVLERNSGFSLIDLFFEVSSAFSTTGLSSIGTPALRPLSQWLLMPLMYLGRVGPLTLAFALANRMNSDRMNRMCYPEEKIMIG